MMMMVEDRCVECGVGIPPGFAVVCCCRMLKPCTCTFLPAKKNGSNAASGLILAYTTCEFRHVCLAYKLYFSTNDEQYFSLTTNQSTVFSVMAYQPSEQGICSGAFTWCCFLSCHHVCMLAAITGTLTVGMEGRINPGKGTRA